MNVGWIIILILLWIRPEYLFLIFYAVANYLLIFLLSVWSLTREEALYYALDMAIGAALTILIGLPIVALFKWLKTRKTGNDRRLDREMESIRADIAARENQRSQE